MVAAAGRFPFLMDIVCLAPSFFFSAGWLTGAAAVVVVVSPPFIVVPITDECHKRIPLLTFYQGNKNPIRSGKRVVAKVLDNFFFFFVSFPLIISPLAVAAATAAGFLSLSLILFLFF